LAHVGRFFSRAVRVVTERPIATIAVVCALALGGLALALQLDTSDSTESLVGGSDAARATEQFHRDFGDEAVRVLVAGDLTQTLLVPSNMATLITLEGCLSGREPEPPPPGQQAPKLPAVCREIREQDVTRSVYGPGTFVLTSASEIANGFNQQKDAALAQGRQAAENARQLAKQRGWSKARQDAVAREVMVQAQRDFQREILSLGIRYGLSGIPSPYRQDFVSQLVFDASRGANEPKARFAYLFPSSKAAVIHVRLEPGLSSSERDRAVGLIRSAARDSLFKLETGSGTEPHRYVVTGVPAFAQGAASAAQSSIYVLLGAAVLVMALTLLVVFRTRARVRLLPLALALGAAAMTYGALKLSGAELTIASVAALPVLIGLAVDYAIQIHARYDESRRGGKDPRRAARTAARRGVPTIAGAALATAGGFLVLLLSPVAIVHGFAAVVILGIALALACAVTAGLATLARFSEPRGRPEDLPPLLPRARAALAQRRAALGRSVVGRVLERPLVGAVLAAICIALAVAAGAARELWLAIAAAAAVALTALTFALLPRAGAALAAAARRRGGAALDYAVARPRKVLAIAAVLALIGFALDPLVKVASDPRELVPQDLPALRDLNDLEDATGVSGDIYVTVNAKDVSSAEVVAWMGKFKSEVLKAHGYKTGDTCLQKGPELCPGPAITDFVGGEPGQAANAAAVLDALPPYFSSALVSPDRKTANLSFGIRLMSLERQHQVIEDIRSRLDPPPGVTADLVGVPVLAADANSELASEWRRMLMLVAGLAAVFLVLLVLRRRLSQAAVPLIPIALASGWSSLVLFLSREPLNPMSATLAALTIAISTEFSVLLSARYRAERDAGAAPRRALERTYRSTGAAVLASGATATAGFSAMIASDWPMLQGFGFVTVINLTVSLLGVMLVLPAALVWAEQRGRLRLADLDPRPVLGRLRPTLPRRTRA
jgi:predicted RND superfamily exporter protein